ncbi:hypothetical protein KGO5_02418 [Sinorhizobium sp. KGO-5]|uniref:hypothetical protein n=1 Tax=Sinorhizobium sp. KGO-5 TaxID=1470810 RepID=UPI002949E0E9|nr:hypothetical protein KGO5_02418 [Sinorhizobium sp. KGO-5]
MHRYAFSLHPDEVDLLSQLFEDELDRRHLDRDEGAAEELAAKIFRLYQSGVREIDDLRQKISGS